MATILDQLVEGARAVTARRRARDSASSLQGRFQDRQHSFAKALSGHGIGIIAESKKASPSQGVIRENYDPGANAEAYERAGAAAMSVLTEPLQFGGELEHLLYARRRCELPLLRKDFIVDEYQLLEARAYGADAVLLIATVLDRPHLSDLLQAARELDLECLVELYDAEELDRVDFDLATVVGANNRNLHTFEVDRAHAPSVLQHVPEGIVTVAESGLGSADDLAFAHASGIDAVLIGEAFMRAPDPGQALKELREQTERLIEEVGQG